MNDLRQRKGVLDSLLALEDTGNGLGLVLAMLKDDHIGQLIDMLGQEGVELDQDSNPVLDSARRPGGKCGLSSSDSVGDIGGRRERDMSNDPCVVRAGDRDCLDGLV